jgi:NTE family protein
MSDAPGTRRALVLAGGGMRVAWQAGVTLALEEAGVAFHHLDGTSGGIMNAAALMSGVSPAQLCARWETLRVRRFVSPMPLTRYLRAPNLLAWGDADGIVDHVFPHLGVDVDALRARTEPTATFNVCNFDDKVSVAVDHREVTVDHLVAGMSLPIAMPPIRRDGVTWTDAVWIRDANLVEAERRGADEIWVVWCIGNTPRYGTGALQQYVHMIEMSAAGALNSEMATIAHRNVERSSPVRVHVIKPRHPLPLDPELLLGRIDARTLVAMGYRDAHAYLATRSPAGVPLDVDASKMTEPEPGVRFRAESRGVLRPAAADERGPAGPATLRVTAELHGMAGLAPGSSPRPAVGSLSTGAQVHYLSGGQATWTADGAMEVVAELVVDGRSHRLRATRRFRSEDGGSRRLWKGLAECEVTLSEPGGAVVTAGTFRTAPAQVAAMFASARPTADHAHRFGRRVRAVRALARLVRRSSRGRG